MFEDFDLGDKFALFFFGFFMFVLALTAIVVISVIVLSITLIFIPYAMEWQTTFNGQHTGTVTAVETNGLFWKTDTVYFKSDAQSSQEDTYCVIDENIKKQLESSAKRKETITIIYDDYLLIGYGLCNGESGIIVGVTK